MAEKKPKVTAREFLEQLAQDPDYQRRRAEQDRELRQREAETARLEAPLCEELRAAGVPLQRSVWDLVNTKEVWPQSLPILAKHLVMPYPPGIKDGIARAMAVPQARFAWQLLLNEYQHESVSRVRQGLAVALSNSAGDEFAEQLVALARNPEYGVSRVLLLDGIGRSSLPTAREDLIDLSKDPILRPHATEVLKKLHMRLNRPKRGKPRLN